MQLVQRGALFDAIMGLLTVKGSEDLQPLVRACYSIKLKQDGMQMLQTGCSAGGSPT